MKPIGFDNQVLESDYSSQYSEMWWEGPDQTKIFGLLLLTGIVMGTKFLQKKKRQSLLETKLADVERYASTNHLLMMNGVDHQPVQKILLRPSL